MLRAFGSQAVRKMEFALNNTANFLYLITDLAQPAPVVRSASKRL